MKQRLFVWITACLCAAGCWAVTQQGNVRTIARKNKVGKPVEGVVIRLQGSHNKVASRTNGDFSLLLHDLRNGEPYTIASIVKSGYEPAEQELIGRRIPCSDLVPLEVLLVSRIDLMQEKEEIETKARENVEVYYRARIDSLERMVAEHRLTQAEWAAQKQRLENQYESFEPLLQAMSDVLARTDYTRMDSLTAMIQQAVENGNPEEAERLLREKGSMAQREAVLREWGKNIRALQQEVDNNRSEYLRQKRVLEDDCYRLYASFLTRFQNDSAACYIRKRAALDTTNVDYQLQAGQFVKDIMADYRSADIYFRRAYRLAESQYGEQSGQMATACNELGLLAKQQRDYTAAAGWYERSLTIREKLRGRNSLAVAEALNNMGELYRAQKDLKKTMDCHRRALKIREKQLGERSLEAAESKFNIAGVYYQQKQYAKAEALYLEVKEVYQANSKTPQTKMAAAFNNLGGVAYMQEKYAEAAAFFQQAVEIYTRVLGAQHPMTRNAMNNSAVCKQKTEH